MNRVITIMRNATRFILGIICGTITAIILNTFIIDPILENQATKALEPKNETLAGHLQR